MEKTIQQNSTQQAGQDLSQWFNNMVAQLRTHELMINEGVAPKEVETFYQNLLNSDLDSHFKAQIPFVHKYMIGNTLKALFSGIGKSITEFDKIALHLGENKIRVWVVLPDDADELDKELILQVAKINAEVENNGYFIDLYTVEKSDNITIPNQFKELTIQ